MYWEQCVHVCLHGCDGSLNDQCNGWTHRLADMKQSGHIDVCVSSFHPCFCVLLPTFTLSLYVPLHLLQLLNLHTCLSSFSLLPLWISPASPTWYASFIFFFFLVHRCPFCQLSYSFHSSIHLLIICPERQSELGSDGDNNRRKVGWYSSVMCHIQVGHRRRAKYKESRGERNVCNSSFRQINFFRQTGTVHPHQKKPSG